MAARDGKEDDALMFIESMRAPETRSLRQAAADLLLDVSSPQRRRRAEPGRSRARRLADLSCRRSNPRRRRRPPDTDEDDDDDDDPPSS